MNTTGRRQRQANNNYAHLCKKQRPNYAKGVGSKVGIKTQGKQKKK